MAQTINTNIQSLIAQSNLFRSGQSLSTSIERLSSGLRINSARDDAAGLAISERMNAQLRGMEVAKRNANDGISALQVADGALSSLGDDLQRMRELAVQSSNGTLSASDRANLDLEFKQLSDELSRVAGGAEFNGVKLLKGDGTAAGGPKQFELQVGATSDSQLTINFENIDSSINSFRATGSQVTLGTPVADPSTLKLSDLGSAATVSVVDSTGTVKANTAALAAGDVVTVNGQDYTVDSSGQINGTTVTGGAAQDLTLGNLGFTAASATDYKNGEYAYVSNGSVSFQLQSDGTNFTKVSAATGIGGKDGKSAQATLDKIDSLLDKVNSQRATLGAGINRLDAVISNLETGSVNLAAARGRIVDADFAKETANLTRTQILQQAGTAMLAQANQLPSSVLTLLR